MKACLYFQIHQPYRLARYRVFDIGRRRDYFDPGLDRIVVERVAERCYRPALDTLATAVDDHDGAFRFALGITSTALEQLETAAPDVLDRVGELAGSGAVEIVAETSHHSLAGLFDTEEMVAQIRRHAREIERSFGVRPAAFRNTEMLYSDELAATVQDLGYRVMLAEGSDALLAGRSSNHVYTSTGRAAQLRVLPRNYRLADDVGFRFSDRGWSEWPLTAGRYAAWVAASGGETANIFLDFETFGEHHDAASGVFAFLSALPAELLRHRVGFHTPIEAAAITPAGSVSAPTPVSWADRERDDSAWLGNRMQRAAAERLYALLPAVRAAGDAELIETWRRLSTSDHLYYASTKGLDDGGVHAYFSPFDSPYDAFIALMNVLTDFERRVEEEKGDRPLFPKLGEKGPVPFFTRPAGDQSDFAL